MEFEELPAEYDQFFKTGVLPDTLKSEAAAPAPAPAPAPTPAPAAKVEAPAPSPAPAQQQPPNLDVYDNALKLAEANRKALEKQLQDLQGKVTELTRTPAPDPETDPLGYINHQMKQLQDQIAGLVNKQTETAQLTEQQQQQQAFINTVNTQIKTFEAANPDYQDAYRHMIQMRTQDYLDSGMTPTEAKAAVSQDELAIAARALQQNKNPAEIVYGMAKRYGYQKAAEKVETPENKLEKIRQGHEASKTIERGDQPVEMTVDNLENMSEADLNKMVENDWEKVFGKQKGIFG